MNKNPVIQLTEPALAHNTDRIHVFLRDCRVELRVGIYESEMQKPTPVIINVEIEAALPHHYQDLAERKLDRVIDYEPIYHFIQGELPTMGHICLLETAAEQILNFCFRDIRVHKARVRIEKPNIFPAASGAGIDMSRIRQ